jgi:hypothetical protein
MKDFIAKVGENTSRKRESWETAPLHMIDHDLQMLDKDKIAKLGAAGGRPQTEARDNRIARMWNENRDIWFERAASHKIAKRWNKRHLDEPVSIRTVQNYVRLSKLKTQAPRGS